MILLLFCLWGSLSNADVLQYPVERKCNHAPKCHHHVLLQKFQQRTKTNNWYNSAYVINRDVDIERFSAFSASARKAGIVMKRFRAVDMDTINTTKLVAAQDISPRIAARMLNTTKIRGSVACTLSHMRLWKKLVQQGPQDATFLIFEDDSVIPDDFNQRLGEALGEVPSNWDMLYLNHNKLVGVNITTSWFVPSQRYPGLGKNAKTNAYMVRVQGLKRILRFMDPIDYEYFDDYLRRNFANFHAYFLIQNLVPQSGAISVRLGLNESKNESKTLKKSVRKSKKSP